MTEFFTDSVHLFEVASRRTVQNYGRARDRMPTISYVVLRDCVSGAEARVGELELLALAEVPVERRAA